jgi:flagellar biosynthesis/type III secretory pathway protein FliH
MTNPTPYTKFAFDTEFFELVQGQEGGAVSRPLTPAQQKLATEDLKQQSYNEGYAAGMAEGHAQAQADLAQMQQHLQNALMALQTAQKEREEQILAQVLSLMRVTLHRMVGQVSSAYGPEVLEHHLRALMNLLTTDEALTLRIHPAARGFHEKLGLPQAAIMGLPMMIVSDGSLGTTDAVVQWTNGGVESKLAQHMIALDTLLAGAGATILPVEGRTNISVAPVAPVMSQPAMTAAAGPSGDMETDAAQAAKDRANALLGDDDDDLVDALK